jgi:hypothetical protein
MRWLRSASVLAALLATGLSAEARSQSPSRSWSDSPLVRRPSVTLSAGAFQYDRLGTETSPVLAARGELPLTSLFLLEGGLATTRPERRVGGPTTLFVPEAQVQAQLPAGPWVAPYLGAGIGAAFDRPVGVTGRSERELTLSVATGVRYWLSEDRGLRAELRVRRVGSELGGTAAEWTVGSSWRL